jgi:ATP-dependent DNA helicase RecQ
VPDLYAALKRYWGYDSFRPMQERIIQSLLGGSDVAVVMPTGGGKSLCYQLPALALDQTVVVISPLIALMQDQVAQLGDMGIPAAVLNSSQPADEQRAVMRAAQQGAFRLLYLSPERLARQDTIGWLEKVPLAFFAIDEAHCISEWGHEFRPEYRQLSSLRQHFPDKPLAAFTASATRRVRHDILQQLQLRDPHKYIASFHRANLRYVAHQCDKQSHSKLLVAAVRANQGQSVIVYAPTIKDVEYTVDFLADRRIPAVPYHGQMETGLRRRNQERWMNDEVRVLVGTIAFGLGINKPAVRAVIHLSLPKSIEQYYQEAGRAGRDGLPADCVMLWQPKDAGLLAYFIEQLKDPDEKERAWQRYHAVRRFAESDRCRHLQICTHFGQTPKWERCGMCDVCGNVPDWMASAPAETPGVKKKRRPKVKAGPARREEPKPEEPQPATRAPAPPTRPHVPPPRPVEVPPIEAEADAPLLQFLKEWRRRAAERANVPAYIILSDAALFDLCRKQPANLRELLGVTGIGERKAELYGGDIFAAFEAYRKGARAAAAEVAQVSPAEETMRLLAEGRNFEEIARIRGRQLATVVNMVADLVEKGRLEYRVEWVGEENHRRIAEVVKRLGSQWLKPLREALPDEITYEQIRLVVSFVRGSAEAGP